MSENFYIKNVSKNGTSLEVEWNDGVKSQFNYMWLRDNCPTAHDPDSRHRMFSILNVSEKLSAKNLNINKDGKLDIIAGNSGLNHKWKANEEFPVKVYLDDFDENSSLDPIIFYNFFDCFNNF